MERIERINLQARNLQTMSSMISIATVNGFLQQSAREQDLKWKLYICQDNSYKYKVNAFYSGYQPIQELYQVRSQNLSYERHITTVLNSVDGGFLITPPLPYTVTIMYMEKESFEYYHMFKIMITNHENVFIILNLACIDKENILDEYHIRKGSGIYLKNGDGKWSVNLDNCIKKIHVFDDNTMTLSSKEMFMEEDQWQEIRNIL